MCHGPEWHSGPCPTPTYHWLDSESNGLGELTHAVDLMKWQNQPKTVRNAQNAHISTKMDIMIIPMLQAWTESKSGIQGL